MNRLLSDKRMILLFLLPALLVYIAAILVPVVWSLVYSFFSINFLNPTRFIGIENYIRMFTRDSVFWAAFRNNLVYVAINIVYQLGFGLLMAIVLNKLVYGRGVFQTFYYAPVVISSVIFAAVFVKIFAADPPGVVNSILGMFNKDLEKMVWFGDMKRALPTIAWVDGYRSMAVYMVILYSALISIPSDMIEAARIDGASGIKLLRYIQLPLIKNMIFTCLILIANGTLKSFDLVFLITNGGPGRASELIASYMYKKAFTSMDFGYASSLSVFLALESMMVVGLIRRFTRRFQEVY